MTDTLIKGDQNAQYPLVKRQDRGSRAQALVEFSLIMPMLIVLIIMFYEMSRILQSFLAVEYAARETARYAVTGQPPMLISDGEGSCEEVGHPDTGASYSLPAQYDQCRADWIKHIGWEYAAPGLMLSEAVTDITKPYYLGVILRGSPSFGAPPVVDNPGAPRTKVEVTVVFNHPITSPFFSTDFPTIRLVSEAQMVNEPWEGGGPENPGEVPPAPPLPPLDTDGDGWSDNDERDTHGTLPGNPDTDDDGYYDGDGTLTPVDPEPLDPCVPDPGMCA